MSNSGNTLDGTCSKCGAAMEIHTIGPMEDKVFKCSYCGNLVDIADSFSITEIEESENGKGNSYSRRKRTHIKKRSDIPVSAFNGSSFFTEESTQPQERSFSTLNFGPQDSPEDIRKKLQESQSIPPEMIDSLMAKITQASPGENSESISRMENIIIDERDSSFFDMDLPENLSTLISDKVLDELKAMNPGMSSEALHQLSKQITRGAKASRNRGVNGKIILAVVLSVAITAALFILAF